MDPRASQLCSSTKETESPGIQSPRRAHRVSQICSDSKSTKAQASRPRLLLRWAGEAWQSWPYFAHVWPRCFLLILMLLPHCRNTQGWSNCTVQAGCLSQIAPHEASHCVFVQRLHQRICGGVVVPAAAVSGRDRRPRRLSCRFQLQGPALSADGPGRGGWLALFSARSACTQDMFGT